MIDPMYRLGYPEGSVEILEETEKLSRELGDERSLGRVYHQFGFYHTVKGNTTLAMEYFDKCLGSGEEIEPAELDLIAPIAADLCTLHLATGDYLKTVGISSRFVPILEEHHREKDLFNSGVNVYSDLSGSWGLALGHMGNFEEGKALLERGLKNAHELNDKLTMALVEWYYSELTYCEGDAERTIDKVQKAIKYTEETELEILSGHVWSTLGHGYYLLGEHETARRHAEKGQKINKERGIVVPMDYCGLSLIQLALAWIPTQGDLVNRDLSETLQFRLFRAALG